MKKLKAHQEDPLAIIVDEARNVALSFGVIWSVEAEAALRKRIASRLGGAQYYLPRHSQTDRYERDQKIREEFNGCNIRELARRYEMSERTVRRILHSTETS